MKKIKYLNLNKSKVKRCNSCTNRNNSKIGQKQKKHDLSTDTSNRFNSYIKINLDDKIKKILINPISKRNDNNNKSKHDSDKKKRNKIKNKKKIEKNGLKRNKSELNIFN